MKKKQTSFNALSVFAAVMLLFFLLNGCKQERNILFNDTFEAYTVGELPGDPWLTSGAGTIFIDTSRAFSGKQSVHFISGEGYANRAFIELEDHFPLPENNYYGAMKMFVEEASPDGVHWTMVQSSGKVVGEAFSAEVRYGGQHEKRLMANYDTKGVKSDCWQHSTLKIPEKRWFDVQWQFDGEKNEMRFWLDGQLVADLTVKGKGEGCLDNDIEGQWLFPLMEKLSIGWVDYQKEGGTRRVWIDDVVLSKTKIQLD
ncbi:MAG: hypothetical protein AAF934_02940 [Bacteroidota bacterium]